jgi:hypothetical protein
MVRSLFSTMLRRPRAADMPVRAKGILLGDDA